MAAPLFSGLDRLRSKRLRPHDRSSLPTPKPRRQSMFMRVLPKSGAPAPARRSPARSARDRLSIQFSKSSASLIPHPSRRVPLAAVLPSPITILASLAAVLGSLATVLALAAIVLASRVGVLVELDSRARPAAEGVPSPTDKFVRPGPATGRRPVPQFPFPRFSTDSCIPAAL